VVLSHRSPLAWVSVDRVREDDDLHPGLRAAWQTLTEAITVYAHSSTLGVPPDDRDCGTLAQRPTRQNWRAAEPAAWVRYLVTVLSVAHCG